jgi:hypothetical protein
MQLTPCGFSNRDIRFSPASGRFARRESNVPVGTFEGSVRTAIEGSCYCYYLDCGTHCCWESHTEPCPQEDRDFECRTGEGHCCLRLLADTQWAAAVYEEDLVPVRSWLVASVRRQVLHLEDRPHDAAVRRLGGAHHQPCAEPLLPFSLPSILCESL